MVTNSTGLQPGDHQPTTDFLTSAAVEALNAISLRCLDCSLLYPSWAPGQPPRYRCDCGGVLDVETVFHLPEQASLSEPSLNTLRELETLPHGARWRQLFDDRVAAPPIWPVSSDRMLLDLSGVWRYRELILPVPEEYVVSRPEGNTNLYPVGTENTGPTRQGYRKIGLYAGLEQLYLKHEGENPTGSFKDRGMTVGVTMAHLYGSAAVACASTGNTSASLASYAAQLGLPGFVFLPAQNVAAGKLAQSLAYNVTMVRIKGDFDAAMTLVEQVCTEQGIYLLNSLNPFRIEGQKAIAFELLQQLDWQAPDWVVLPAGNLGNTSAIGKAFLQAYELGLISHLPRIAAIQAAGANPFFRSYQQNFKRRERVHAETVATAIKIGNPVSYSRARAVILESNGLVEEVTDAEILEAKSLIDQSGIGCEPASAATLAGIHKLVNRGVIQHDEHVVGILTGTLLKDPSTGIPPIPSGEPVEPTMEAVKRALRF